MCKNLENHLIKIYHSKRSQRDATLENAKKELESSVKRHRNKSFQLKIFHKQQDSAKNSNGLNSISFNHGQIALTTTKNSSNVTSSGPLRDSLNRTNPFMIIPSNKT